MASERLLVEQEVRIEASPQTVYDFLSDPALMTRWMGSSVNLEPRPGGIYRCDINGRDIARGEFVELVPHSRVVFSFGWEADGAPIPPGGSTVEITLTAEGAATLVRLVHRDVPREAADSHAEGWRHYLDRLAVAAAGGDAGPDPMANPGAMQR